MTATSFRHNWRNDLQELIFAHTSDVMAGKSTEAMMEPVIELALKIFNCCLVHVWSVDPRRETLVLVAQGSSQKVGTEILDVIDVATSYTGIAFETRQPQVHVDLDGIDGRRFWDTALRKEFGLKSFVSLPLRNLGNPHQVTNIVNFYFDFELPRILKDQKLANEFRRYAGLLGSSYESNLRERAFRMSARVSLALGRLERLTAETGCGALAKTLKEAINSDWVSVFLENWNGTALVHRASETVEGVKIPDEATIPEAVTSVWKNNRELLLLNAAEGSKSGEVVGSYKSNIASSVLVPLHDVRGSCKGVIRCVNFTWPDTEPWRRRHSYDDIAVVESMERAFAPPLDMLLQSQARDVSLRNLAHELRVPVVALRAVHERMEREYDDGKMWFKFRYPYFNEVRTFTNVMARQLRQLEIARVGPEQIMMQKQRTRLLSDVIQPAIRFTFPLLKERGMGSHQITHDGFEDLPIIDVDRGLLTQIVFNLLDNMIKYFPKRRPTSLFEGEVVCTQGFGRIEIAFRDNGPGILESEKEQIFEHGYRGEGTEQSNVQGTGLGCWLAREIARRHGGDLKVHSHFPFELVLELPHPRLRNIKGL